ncbi:MAG: TolC family protein [Planctomycetota bacterium]
MRGRSLLAVVGAACAVTLSACRSAESYREEADNVALDIVDQAQQAALGRSEPFTIERPAAALRERLLIDQNLAVTSLASFGVTALPGGERWPDANYLDKPDIGFYAGLADDGTASEPIVLGLIEALAVAAQNSRAFQDQKETVFSAALSLDLNRDAFRPTFGGGAEFSAIANLSGDEDVSGYEFQPDLSVSRQFQNGVNVTGLIGLNLVELFTQSESSSISLFGDAAVSVPLLRGSGEHIVREPLTQAERDTIYAIYNFERFKRTFVVNVATDYLSVLRDEDGVINAEQNYRSLILAARRLRRLADEGRISEVEVDQAVQDELSARNGWINAQRTFDRSLDNFRILIGLPTDANVALDRQELERLALAVTNTLGSTDPTASGTGADGEEGADAPIELVKPSQEDGGPYEVDEEFAVRLALSNRLDLRRELGEVIDARRDVVISADALRAELTLGASASQGERRTLQNATSDDSTSLRFDDGIYEGVLTIDLPFERTAERNDYRVSLINYERAVRSVQALEDQIKADVRDQLRLLLTNRESLAIQAAAVRLAERRVESTRLFLEIGRAQTRDLLDAQESLISAQNALTNALVNYRIAELEIQSDMGVLMVNEDALWTELGPTELQALAPEPAGPPMPGGEAFPGVRPGSTVDPVTEATQGLQASRS